MYRSSGLRTAVLLFGLGVVGLAAWAGETIPAVRAASITIWRDVHPYLGGVVEHVLAAGSLFALSFNFKRVVAFIRRTIQPTDDLIVGPWYVYRYTRHYGNYIFLADTWIIKRNLHRRYTVNVSPRLQGRSKFGELVYNERDRFSILLTGQDHKEQSLICFCPRIPIGNDSRTLGLGVGDDADYTLSARIYLASRAPLPDDYAKAVIEDAAQNLDRGEEARLLQLSPHLVADVFGRHPLPAAPVYKAGKSKQRSPSG